MKTLKHLQDEDVIKDKKDTDKKIKVKDEKEIEKNSDEKVEVTEEDEFNLSLAKMEEEIKTKNT